MRISDWSSDVCSSDLGGAEAEGEPGQRRQVGGAADPLGEGQPHALALAEVGDHQAEEDEREHDLPDRQGADTALLVEGADDEDHRDDGEVMGDRKSVVQGKRMYGRVDLGGSRIIKKKKTKEKKKD